MSQQPPTFAQWPQQGQWIGGQWVGQPQSLPSAVQQGWNLPVQGQAQAAVQSQSHPQTGAGQPQPQPRPQSPPGAQQVPTGTSTQWAIAAQGQAPAQPQIPPVDVLETPEELLVLVDMAGFDEDDIQLDIDNDVLRIAASRTLEIEDDETLLAQERPTRFERYLQLPVEANIEDASAKQADGVCRITLPKSESARDRHHRIGFQ